MRLDTALAARRALLDRPQRLGFVPTLWFWNDAARQGLLLPLVIATAIPLVLLVQFLAVRIPALAGPLLLAVVLFPFLLMGLVERHIRRRLLTGPVALPREPDDDPDRFERLGRAVPVVVGLLGALLLVLAGPGPTPLLIALAAALALLAALLLPRTYGAVGRAIAAEDPRPSLPSGSGDP
ncbi:MAG TPA: hypothetical protein VIK91_24060 [Nannocystis sp.]